MTDAKIGMPESAGMEAPLKKPRLKTDDTKTIPGGGWGVPDARLPNTISRESPDLQIPDKA